MQELTSKYNPAEIETRWFDFYAKTPLFSASSGTDAKPYTIVIPPPNVTGILHMGHALNNTIQDILIRARRMQGYQALWMPGTDHAGIATQNVVERQIAKDGLKRQDLGREKFLERVWEWKQQYGSTIIHQLKRLGASCDWPRERFTMDADYSKAVVEVFVRLYEKGLIYRGHYIINWCPRCQTALADEEAPHHELDGHLYYIKYPLKNPVASTADKKSQSARQKAVLTDVVVATTRPETMLGDTAVAVHPKDKRYKHLIGRTLILPLVNREIAVIADELIDRKFGTGCVKVTPAHDPNDYVMGKRHGLDFINIMKPDGILNENAGEYMGMDRFEAREAILEDLKERGLLVKVEPHHHAVGHCYRCHTVIEPYLSKQWFVKMEPLSKPAIKAVKTGRITFHPRRWTKVYLNWMENIKDWCISRQIWWGHRLPVYYCQDCLAAGQQGELTRKEKRVSEPPHGQKGVIVSAVKPQKCPHCQGTHLEQDPDVLDTWFSSWLWPFATFGWPFCEQPTTEQGRRLMAQQRKDLAYFYPTSTLVTAPEIIFFWVARMIMAGCEFMKEIPFRDVYIHGTVRDEQGRKMSKSLGNSIDPLEIIKEYGADALRFSLISTAASGADIYLSQERFEQGRNFCNKIWNASRLIMMSLPEGVTDEELDVKALKIQDVWILGQLNATIRRVDKALDHFKLNEALNALYAFFWHSFCDWYLEIAKIDRNSMETQKVLLYVLRRVLALLHPFMPFISDEILSRLPGGVLETAALGPWPHPVKLPREKQAIAVMKLVQECALSVRNLRAQVNLAPSVKPRVVLSAGKQTRDILDKGLGLVAHLCGLESVSWCEDNAPQTQSVSALAASDVRVFLMLEGVADIVKEKERVVNQLAQTEALIRQKEAMLNNKKFLERAPAEVVAKEKERLSELLLTRERLTEIKNGL